uniref:U6 snRNA-associated Sm-like protein LSm1 n=1 Tax=Lygus hesperus TaxID=30085 RepID=A0A0A9YX44_LYGHE
MNKNDEGFRIPVEAAQYAVDGSMIDTLDCDVLVYTRDGKYFIGRLISFDQYGSIVLKRAQERLIFQNMYNDRNIGIVIISTSSIVYIGRHVRCIYFHTFTTLSFFN